MFEFFTKNIHENDESFKEREFEFSIKGSENNYEPFQFNGPSENHVVLLMGFPGSGKTTLSKKYFSKKEYKIIELDKTGGSVKIPLSKQGKLKKSVVIDGVNNSKDRREMVLCDVPKGVDTYCIHLDLDAEQANYRNKQRALDQKKNLGKRYAPVPDKIYDLIKRHYEEPSLDEGFKEIIKCYPYGDYYGKKERYTLSLSDQILICFFIFIINIYFYRCYYDRYIKE